MRLYRGACKGIFDAIFRLFSATVSITVTTVRVVSKNVDLFAESLLVKLQGHNVIKLN